MAAAGAGGLAVGLAGCTGSRPGDAGAGGDGTPTPGPDGEGGDSGNEDDAAATPPEEFSCDAYAVSATRAYETEGTPLLVSFDVPERYEQAGSYPEPERYVEEIQSPIVDFHQVFVVVDQRYEALTPAGVEEDIEREVADRTRGSNPAFAPVDSFEFAGETVALYGTPAFPADGAVQAAWLPHETSEGKRYFKTFLGLTTSAAFYGEDDEGAPELSCLETLRAINDVVVSSLAPNPGTTIGEQG